MRVKKIISFNEEKKESYEVVLLEEVKFNQDLERRTKHQKEILDEQYNTSRVSNRKRF